MVIATASNINLAAGWSTVWTAVSGALGSKLTTLMTAIGVILVVFSILAWLWERRKGGGGGSGHNKLVWTLIFGAILVSPNLLIPLLLNIADFIANAIVNLLGA